MLKGQQCHQHTLSPWSLYSASKTTVKSEPSHMALLLVHVDPIERILLPQLPKEFD
jgi:hypothetical protein